MVAFGAMLARTFAEPAADAPYRLPEWAQMLQLVFDFVILGLVVALGRGRFWHWSSRQPDRPYAILVAGAVLFAALPAMLPVAQHHYWAHAAPLFAVLIVEHWRRARNAAPSVPLVGMGGRRAASPISRPGVSLWEPLRDHGPTTLVMLVLVAAGLRRARPRLRRTQPGSGSELRPRTQSARPAPTAA